MEQQAQHPGVGQVPPGRKRCIVHALFREVGRNRSAMNIVVLVCDGIGDAIDGYFARTMKLQAAPRKRTSTLGLKKDANPRVW